MSKPLTDAITALTTYANTVTGASDETLSEAVATLANGYGGGGGNDDALLEGTLSGAYVNDSVTKLKASVFQDQPNLTSVSLPSVTNIGNSVFRTLGNLTSVNLPNVTSIGQYCFYGDSKLNNVSLLKLVTVGANAFENCTSLTVLKLPVATSMGHSALKNCRFSVIVLPKMTSPNTQAVCNNANLTTVDFGPINNIGGGNIFMNDTSLATLIIRKTGTVPTLGNINAFSNTPFADGGTGGTLYVPQSLISSYQSATNWSTILGYANNSIQAIEGSIYETQYADGTPIE